MAAAGSCGFGARVTNISQNCVQVAIGLSDNSSKGTRWLEGTNTKCNKEFCGRWICAKAALNSDKAKAMLI